MDYKFRGGGKGSISLHCTYAVIYMTCQRLYKKKKKMVKEEEEERPSLSHFVCVWAFVGLCVCAVVEVAACSKPVKTAGVPSESNTLWKKKISSSFGKKKKRKFHIWTLAGTFFLFFLPSCISTGRPAFLKFTVAGRYHLTFYQEKNPWKDLHLILQHSKGQVV